MKDSYSICVLVEAAKRINCVTLYSLLIVFDILLFYISFEI
jgi:hypothetical protein